MADESTEKRLDEIAKSRMEGEGGGQLNDRAGEIKKVLSKEHFIQLPSKPISVHDRNIVFPSETGSARDADKVFSQNAVSAAKMSNFDDRSRFMADAVSEFNVLFFMLIKGEIELDSKELARVYDELRSLSKVAADKFKPAFDQEGNGIFVQGEKGPQMSQEYKDAYEIAGKVAYDGAPKMVALLVPEMDKLEIPKAIDYVLRTATLADIGEFVRESVNLSADFTEANIVEKAKEFYPTGDWFRPDIDKLTDEQNRPQLTKPEHKKILAVLLSLANLTWIAGQAHRARYETQMKGLTPDHPDYYKRVKLKDGSPFQNYGTLPAEYFRVHASEGGPVDPVRGYVKAVIEIYKDFTQPKKFMAPPSGRS